MDGNVAERDNIASFYLRVYCAKRLWETCYRFPNDSELLENGSLVEFTGEKRRGIQAS
jgi:hypothetical protein